MTPTTREIDKFVGREDTDITLARRLTQRDGTTKVDLTNATSVTVMVDEAYTRSAGVKRRRSVDAVPLVTKAAAITAPATNGDVTVSLTPAEVPNAGEMFVQWKVVWSDGRIEFYPLVGFDELLVQPNVV